MSHDESPAEQPGGIDQDRLKAAVELIGRTGAQSMNFGHLDDDVPADQARWWAEATYRGAKIIAEGHAGPLEALEGLAQRLLTGAQCQRCGGLVALSDDGAMFVPGVIVNGQEWTVEQARAAGNCRWRRVGSRWEPGCQVALEPEPGDEIHTAEQLARALEALNDPTLGAIVRKARQGYYHDFLSPLALPEMQLVEDLRAAGHAVFSQRVIAGEFDASKAESEAWGRSEDGQEAFASLLPGGATAAPAGNRAERRGNRGRPEGGGLLGRGRNSNAKRKKRKGKR